MKKLNGDIMEDESCAVNGTLIVFKQYLDSYIINICGFDLVFNSKRRAKVIYEGIKEHCNSINF
jgi:hypothetical protein